MFMWSRQLAERNDDTEINDESDVKDEKMDISQPWHQRGRNKNSGQQGNMLYKNRVKAVSVLCFCNFDPFLHLFFLIVLIFLSSE